MYCVSSAVVCVCNNTSEDGAFLLRALLSQAPLACAPLLTPVALRLALSQHKMEEVYELLEKKNAKEKNRCGILKNML